MSYTTIDQQIKRRIVEIISSYRGLSYLSGSEVRINNQAHQQGHYVVSGDYKSTGLLGAIIEEGTFRIKLSEQGLNTEEVSIYPKKQQQQARW